MVEQERERREAPRKKGVDKVSVAIASLVIAGGTLISGVAGYQFGKFFYEQETPRETINEYGVWLEKGAVMIPDEYQVIVGRLAVEESGEPLGSLNASLLNIYVTGEFDSDVKGPLQHLIAESSVVVYPQSSARNTRKMAEQVRDHPRRQDDFGAFAIVTIPGFTSPPRTK